MTRQAAYTISNARWYDSELGKFTTSDPIRDGVNWWNYCNGNPISFVDADGKQVAMPSPLGVPIILPVYPVLVSDSPSSTILDDGIISSDGHHLIGNDDKNKKDTRKNLQESTKTPSPNLNPNDDNNDNDDNDDEPLTPEKIEKYNKDVKEQYKNQLENSQSTTETPWNPSETTELNQTPSNLRGWRKIIYFLGKLTELFDNIQEEGGVK